MDQRTRVAINCIFSDYWVAGTYYILNLVKALKSLPDEKKPVLIFFNLGEQDIKTISDLSYPYTEFISISLDYSRPIKAINWISKRLTGKHLVEKRPTSKEIDAVFPLGAKSVFYELIDKKAFWLADFQHHYFKDLFSEEDFAKRVENENYIAAKNFTVIFSSKDSEKDFQKFYPDNNCKTRIVNFAVTNPDISHLSIKEMEAKYNFSGNYFFVPNQFWIHKNHILVLKAAKILADQGLSFNIIFTGSPKDYRNPDHYPSLMKFVDENKLHNYLHFLGFIDRNDQLCLMKHAICLIQPSLFEGWSTSIEDAKSLNKFVLASDIPVHHEQVPDNSAFFDPYNEQILANQLEKYISDSVTPELKDYSVNVHKFAIEFMNAIK